MQRTLVGLSMVFWLLVSISNSLAQDNDDEDFSPGLSATYTASGNTIHRVDDDVAFVWEDDSPDPRLPQGLFQVDWEGSLLVREPGEYRFSAFLQGRVTVRVGDRVLLSGERGTAGWLTGEPQSLEFGELPLQVQFAKTEATAEIKLYWSAGHFQREPIPGHLLFRQNSHPTSQLIESGRVLYDVHRCNRCHRREGQPLSLPAPSLEQVAGGLSREWLITKLSQPEDSGLHAKMPHFGFNRDEAVAISAFLLQGKPAELEKIPQFQPPKEKSNPPAKEPLSHLRRGEVLFRSVGCLACHAHGEHGSTAPYAGGDLTNIRRKRSREWVYTWLAAPEKLNRDHRMPIIKLTSQERAELAMYLTGEIQPSDANEKPASASSEDLIETGRKLIAAARCANCHRIPGIEQDLQNIPSLTKSSLNWDRSCVSPKPDRAKHRPAYPHINRDAVTAFVVAHSGSRAEESQFARGRRLLQQKNCLSCHERDRSKGIVATAGAMAQLDRKLVGQSEGLIPPALMAVGDKLTDAGLAIAIGGNQKQVRLPWLSVRMPRFSHTKPQQQALLKYLVGHDRIPDYDAPDDRASGKTDRTQALLAGHELVGGKGFSCVACHAFGKFQPLNVALGTRGSDLLMLAQRMRRSYFLRWTRFPLRIVPGMEMPSFDKPVPGILQGDHERQLAAIWDALNDPNFTVPTNPAVVEQYLVVRPDSPARVVHDVFTNHKSARGYTPRALAVGFANRHNVLFDLDTFSLRQWWLGDFARQRTQGKSWFWDAAGITVFVAGPPNQTDVVLRKSANETLVFPQREHGTHGRLLRYQSTGEGLRFAYELNYDLDGRAQSVTVEEYVAPLTESEPTERTGWMRRIQLRTIPEGYEAAFLHHSPKTSFGAPTVETDLAWESNAAQGAEPERSVRMVLLPQTAGTAEGTFRYFSTLQPEQLLPNPPISQKLPLEKVTSVPGFDGVRLPLPRSIMPSAMTWTAEGKLAFTSLKGQVYIAEDSDGDGIEDRLQLFEEGLASPFGIIADGKDLIVSHKPEVLRLRDTDGDGRADLREVVASGWGFNENYHDWTCGIVRDSSGNLYVGLGSDYGQKQRNSEQTRWRGKLLRIGPDGQVEPVGHDLRYPTGLAIDQFDRVFMSDQQGVQNIFNEINYLVPGRGYGVTSPHRSSPDSPPMWAAVQLPHPWTRSVNGIFFLNPKLVKDPGVLEPFIGHGLGCEYHTMPLIRFTTQQVGNTLQGATYRFGLPHGEVSEGDSVGALSGGVSPEGDIYIGGIQDSGWVGGHNIGDIIRLRPNGKLPLGIKVLRAGYRSFQLSFTAPIDPVAAADPENYSISAYTRVWKGGYATPDSGRHQVEVTGVKVAADHRSVVLSIDQFKQPYVYEVTCRRIGPDRETPLWPTTGYYTMVEIPTKD